MVLPVSTYQDDDDDDDDWCYTAIFMSVGMFHSHGKGTEFLLMMQKC